MIVESECVLLATFVHAKTGSLKWENMKSVPVCVDWDFKRGVEKGVEVLDCVR